MTSTVTDPTIISNAIFAQIQTMFTTKTLDQASIIAILTSSMQLVEAYNVDGDIKKSIVLSVASMVVAAAPISADLKATLNGFLLNTAPAMIDTLISVANGDISISQLTGGCCS